MENLKISVYLFNRQNITAGLYGIGTYIEELSKGILTYPNVNFNIVHFGVNNCNKIEKINIKLNLSCIYIPKPENVDPFSSTFNEIVIDSLSEFISSDNENIFHFNYSMDVSLAKRIKEKYVGKLIYVVHCFQWYEDFNGNKKKYHEWYNKNKNLENLSYKNDKLISDLADHIICVTEHAKKELINDFFISAKKITTIYNGLQPSELVPTKFNKVELKKKLGFKNSDKLILYVGRLFDTKGIKTLLKAFHIVIAKSPHTHLIIIGDGSYNNYLPNCNGIWRNVHFTGLIPRDKVFEFYKVANVGVIPSWFEWCSFVALEMMKMKLPVVSSNAGGLDEIFEHEKTALKVNIEVNNDGQIIIDENILADYLLEILDSDIGERVLAAAAHDSFMMRYTANTMIAKTISTYSKQFD